MYRLLLLPFLLASCTHAYYAPNNAHAPMLQEGGEVRAALMGSTSSDVGMNGGELQAAAALAPNFGLMVNGMAIGRTDRFSESGGGGTTTNIERSRIRYAEAAPGFFIPFGNRNSWIFETYAGAGTGKAINQFTGGASIRSGFSKIFVQPSIGFRIPHVEAAFALRIGQVSWKEGTYFPGSQSNSEAEEAIAAIRNDRSFGVVEPSITVRGGGRRLKAQISFSSSRSKYSESYYIDYGLSPMVERGIFGLGIFYALNKQRVASSE